MKLSHLRKRIQSLSVAEATFRVSRKGRQFYDCYLQDRSRFSSQLRDLIRLKGHGKNLSASIYWEHWKEKDSFYFSSQDRIDITSFLNTNYPQKVRVLQQKADSICDLQLSIFNKKFSYSKDIDWNRDPVSGRSWALDHWSKIKVVDTESGIDPKYVWELNRHQFLLYTAMSFFITRNDKYAEFTLKQIIDWIDKNPVNFGINWVESLEVGTRLVSWIWILELLRGAKSLTSDTLVSIVSSMHSHAKHLSCYFSHYISPNTHLTGEAIALFMYAAVYPEDFLAQKWEITAKQILDEEIILQVGDDGVHKELSTAYHTYTVEYYFQYLVLCLHQKKQINSVVTNRLEKMCEFILFAERPDGSVPLLGDSDGGYAFPVDPEQSLSWKHILCNAALLFDRADFKYRSPHFSWDSIWLWGREGVRKFKNIPTKMPQLESCYFSNSNYIIYRSDWSIKGDYLLFDVGKMGFYSAGHSHADYLSFDLCLGGVCYVNDIGTFSYHDKFWRNYCRGTRAHNTVMIDGKDQVSSAGSFSWKGDFKKGLGWLKQCQEFTVIQGSHEAYSGIVHTRTFVIVKDSFIVCIDQFFTTNYHNYEFNYHFTPNVSVVLNEETVSITGDFDDGLLMRPIVSPKAVINLFHSNNDSGLGFYFPTYGNKQQIDSLSIVDNDTGNSIRGMIFLKSFDGSFNQDIQKIESTKGNYFSLLSSGVCHNIYLNNHTDSVEVGEEFTIDCDLLIKQYENSRETGCFAVGIRSLRYKQRVFFSSSKKISFLMIRPKHDQIHVYTDESDQIEIEEEIESIVLHSLPS